MNFPESQSSYASRVRMIRDLLINKTDHNTSDFVGCAQEEVDRVESAIGQTLPPSMLAYYRLLGNGAGAIFNDSKALCAELPKIRNTAVEILADEDGPALPDDAIVFSERYGEQFLFVSANGSPDPEVMRYLEGDEEFTELGMSFLDIVESEAQAVISTYERTGSIRRHVRTLEDRDG